MPVEKVTPILNVSSIADSFLWFEKLGWQRAFAWNGAGMVGSEDQVEVENEHGPADFGGVCQGQVNIFLCVDAQGSRGTRKPRSPRDHDTGGVWMTWWVTTKDEVDQIYENASSHGMEISHPPTDEPWGVREFHLRHPDGHTIRVSSGIE